MSRSLQTSPDAFRLARRLATLGLRTVAAVQLHQNHTVMVSLSGRRRRVLRVHRGYCFAPDRVLGAIVTFVGPRVPRAERARAERELLAFPVADFVPPRPHQRSPERPGPKDLETLGQLAALHHELNRKYFGGRLPAVAIRLSSRMRTRLGELTLDDRSRRPREIAIARRHVARDLWEEVRHTLLHEMVHQWQAEASLAVDHGPTFRRKALEVGVEPTAQRTVRSRRRAARYR